MFRKDLHIGGYYHVYNRGVEKRDTFLDNHDRRTFVQKLLHATTDNIKIVAFCLMNNHYHLLVQQVSDYGLSKCMQSLGVGYTKYFNNRHKRVGALFGSSYNMKYIHNDNQLVHVSRYIHLNPIKHAIKDGVGKIQIQSLLRDLEQSEWNSYGCYVRKKAPTDIIHSKIVLDQFTNKEEYRVFVNTHALFYLRDKTAVLSRR